MLNPYVYEKLHEQRLQELEREHALMRALLPAARPPRPSGRRPAFFFARPAGTALRKLGERLESWASPPAPEMEQEAVRVHGRGG